MTPVRQRLIDYHAATEALGDLYCRRIVLTLSGADRVVEFGVVRIDLAFTSPAVRERIIERKTPLGDILIGHEVLRRIEPRWYLKVEGSCPLLTGANTLGDGAAFGRVGTIYCHGAPAIELLEIVTPA